MTETAFSGGFYETSRRQNHVGTVWKMGKKKEQKYGLLTAMRDVSLEKIKWESETRNPLGDLHLCNQSMSYPV